MKQMKYTRSFTQKIDEGICQQARSKNIRSKKIRSKKIRSKKIRSKKYRNKKPKRMAWALWRLVLGSLIRFDQAVLNEFTQIGVRLF